MCSTWQDPPENISLDSSEVHLWRTALDQPENVLDRLAGSLSEDENTRCARFRFPHLRRKYQVGRGVLRDILGRYLGQAPTSLRFIYGDYGKPFLLPGPNPGSIQFNLAHSREIALYAITSGRNVGVDLEAARPLNDLDQLALQNFSPREYSDYSRLSPDERQAAFFRCWTRKEAFIKAIGEGLSYPLDQFDVTLLPGQPTGLLAIRGDKQAAARWSMIDPDPGPGYTAALVVEGSLSRVRCYDWRYPLGARQVE